VYPRPCSLSTSSCFSSGDIRAKITPLMSIWEAPSEKRPISSCSASRQQQRCRTYSLESVDWSEINHPSEDLARDCKRVLVRLVVGLSKLISRRVLGSKRVLVELDAFVVDGRPFNSGVCGFGIAWKGREAQSAHPPFS
jgi:hypothetical protein